MRDFAPRGNHGGGRESIVRDAEVVTHPVSDQEVKDAL